jgi:hypothetical protein
MSVVFFVLFVIACVYGNYQKREREAENKIWQSLRTEAYRQGVTESQERYRRYGTFTIL